MKLNIENDYNLRSKMTTFPGPDSITMNINLNPRFAIDLFVIFYWEDKKYKATASWPSLDFNFVEENKVVVGDLKYNFLHFIEKLKNSDWEK